MFSDNKNQLRNLRFINQLNFRTMVTSIRINRIKKCGLVFYLVMLGCATVKSQNCGLPNVRCVDDTPGPNQEYATLQLAANASLPGDTILVFDGTYVGFQQNNSGTATSLITFKTVGTNALINAPCPTGDGIRLQNVSNVVLKGFNIRNATQNGIAARGATAVSPMTNVTIKNNKIRNIQWGGLYVSQISNSLVEDNIIDSVGIINGTHGIYLANAGSDNTIIRGNTISNTGAAGIHCNGDLSVGGDGLISNIIIERNKIFNVVDKGISFDGVQNSTIVNNLVYTNTTHGLRGYQVDGAAGPLNLKIINNTFVVLGLTTSAYPIRLTADLGGHVFFNNILINNSSNGGSIAVGNLTFSSNRNIFSNRFSTDGGVTVTNLAAWQTNTGEDMASIISTSTALFINPVANNYHLISTSPAINFGLASFASYFAPIVDLDLNSRPQSSGFDAGCYEFLSPASIQEKRLHDNLSVYPNPGNGKFHVVINDFVYRKSNLEAYDNLEVYNLMGERVYQFVITDPVSEIDLSHLASGSYIIKFHSDSGFANKKIVIQK